MNSLPQNPKPTRLLITSALATTALALSACGANTDPLDDDADTEASDEAIVIGSQAYYSNEIIAEIYAQALEEEGFEIQREFQIGQREVYLPELEDGKLDLLPDYSGNLVQYYQDDAETGSPEEVHQQAQDAVPDGLMVLDWAEATDQDSYTVTADTAERYDLETIADLSAVGDSVTMAANSEFDARPYGPEGALEVYGVTVEVVGVEDSGGPLTVGALVDGDVEVADIYTSSPAITEENLVVLDDPEHLILPQNVVPVASEELDDDAVSVINDIQADLSPDALVELNTQSVNDQASSADVAAQWLADRD